ncbi:MAG TPA: hypothetical protein VJ770_11175 [Stellaceae bacterium]|nr:hypothetical protein [Stellaceae bacterium]
METVVATVITSLIGGALAKAKKIGSAAIYGAYEGLKQAVIKELGGKTGAVQSIEDEPDSDDARSMLTKQLGNVELKQVEELEKLAEHLQQAVAAAQKDGVAGAGDINFKDVRGKVNATVSDLKAAGSITFGNVIAEIGSASVHGLTAGIDPKKA